MKIEAGGAVGRLLKTAAEPQAIPQAVPAPNATPPVKTEPRRPRFWIFGGAVVVLMAAAAAAWWLLHAAPSPRYATSTASIGPITRTVVSTGTVNPELTIIVGSYVSGVIQSLSCDYNTQVVRGQLCAKIDDRPYQTVVDQAKANLDVAEAQLEKDKAALNYAKVTFERNAALLKTQAASKDAYDNAEATYQQAKAQIAFDEATIEQRRAALDAAQVNLDYTKIVSPVDGTVVSRNVTIGQTVAASFQTPTLFLIATDLTKMQVDANVSESDIGGIKQGNGATFTVDAFARRQFKGTVTQVRQSPQTVQNVVTYDVVVSVDNADHALKPGMTAATQIIVDQRNDVLRVPLQALRFVPSGTAAGKVDQQRVWVLRDGAPAAVPVKIGLSDNDNVEIRSGAVRAGDTVIVAEQRNSTGSSSGTPRPRL